MVKIISSMSDVEDAVNKNLENPDRQKQLICTAYKYCSTYQLIKAIYYYAGEYAGAMIFGEKTKRIQEIKLQAQALLHALFFYDNHNWGSIKLSLFYKLAMILDLN